MLLPNAEQQFCDSNGNPYSLGTVDFYIPSTYTRKDTYQDAAQTILNTNPITLDAAGRAVIFGTGSYRQILKDSTGVQIWDKLTYSADPDGDASDPTIQYFAGDGTTVAFTLSQDSGTDSNNIEVYIRSQNNVASNSWSGRVPPNQYTVNGTTLTFTTAPDNGINPGTGVAFNNILVLYPNSSVASAVANAEDASVSAQAAALALPWTFATSTVMADPGTGKLRLNNAAPASVTAIAISALSELTGNPDVSDYILTWDDGAGGTLVIRTNASLSKFMQYTVSAVTDNGTWLQLTVVWLAPVTPPALFAADDLLYLGVAINGSNGTGIVDSVTAGDGTITIGGTASNPTVIVASLGVATGNIANSAVTYAKMQNVSAAGRLLGRESTGAGAVEEITPNTGLAISGTNLNLADTAVTPGSYTNMSGTVDAQGRLSAASSGTGATNDMVLVQDQAGSGTTGPTYTAGAWRTVLLDTEVTDTGGIASLASNQVTLAAGSYEFDAQTVFSPAGAPTGARLRLRNTSDSATISQGVQGLIGATTNNPGNTITISGSFVIAGSKTFELQVYPKTNDIAAGSAMTTGEVEIYASIRFRRYAT